MHVVFVGGLSGSLIDFIAERVIADLRDRYPFLGAVLSVHVYELFV